MYRVVQQPCAHSCTCVSHTVQCPRAHAFVNVIGRACAAHLADCVNESVCWCVLDEDYHIISVGFQSLGSDLLRGQICTGFVLYCKAKVICCEIAHSAVFYMITF